MIEILFLLVRLNRLLASNSEPYIIKCNNRFCTLNQANWRKIEFIAKNECCAKQLVHLDLVHDCICLQNLLERKREKETGKGELKTKTKEK